MLNNKELKTIKEKLPRNYFNKIIEIFKKNNETLSRGTIRRVFNGESDRPDVIEAALKVISNQKKLEQKLKNRI